MGVMTVEKGSKRYDATGLEHGREAFMNQEIWETSVSTLMLFQ
jgi:hypothetical protein